MLQEPRRTSVFTRRALLMMAGQMVTLGVLAARLYQVQVKDGGRYATLAEENRIRVSASPENKQRPMTILIAFIGWCILFVLCWPLAVLALLLFPLFCLLALPLFLVGVTLEAVFAVVRALLFLPARLLGFGRRR